MSHKQNLSPAESLFPFPSRTLPIPISQAFKQSSAQAFEHPSKKAAEQASNKGIGEMEGKEAVAGGTCKKFRQVSRESPQGARADTGRLPTAASARKRHRLDPEFPTLTFGDLRFLADLGVRWDAGSVYES